AAHLLPSFATRNRPAPEVAVVRPLSGNRHGLLYRIGHDRVTGILVAGVVGVATVISIAPQAATADAPAMGAVDGATSGPVGGPVGGPSGDGSAPRLAVGGAFAVEQKPTGPEQADVPVTPEFREVNPVTYAPAAREELISGPFLEDGTLLKPVSVDTTVPDGKDLLRRHKVKSGETLASLSKKFKVDKATIFWASKLTSIKLRPGQKLTIPPVNGLVVTVKSTDTLKSLARKYKVKTDAILEANKLEDSNLVMGQVLVLPGAKGKPLPKPKPAASRASRVFNGAAPAQYRGGRFAWPVAGGELSQGYHYGHYGIDIAADSGTPVKAGASGKVIFAGWKNNGGGYQVWIAHGSNLYTTYNHMSSLTVGNGQSVGRGQQVGRVGMTGYATGPHLHFEVWRGMVWDGGQRVNPLNYL
ncbi:MAG TPA: M23 family metallopeptidase, partial [Actinomycetota bacterium]|nr:M23 family metallopeptidase [Actinomycetota bacterium]